MGSDSPSEHYSQKPAVRMLESGPDLLRLLLSSLPLLLCRGFDEPLLHGSPFLLGPLIDTVHD